MKNKFIASMDTFIKPFINFIQYEKRLSDNTIKAYVNDLSQFQLYLKSTYDVQNLVKAEFQMIRSWVVSLIELQDTSTTINRKISCLKSFYKFAMLQNWIKINPTSKLLRPKSPQRLPKDIPVKKMQDLIDYLNIQANDQTFDTARDYAMFMTFYYLGIRRIELIDLTWSQMDATMNQVKVLGKGKKERIVPIHSQLKEILIKYKKNVSEQNFLEHSDVIFITNQGKKLYPNFVYRIIKQYLSLISSQTGIGPHTLRHSFATHLLNEGAELNAIKDLLGHATLASTQVYTHNSIEKLKKIYEFSHPKS